MLNQLDYFKNKKMNRNLINEEIERARLLMGYSSKKTLTENIELTSNEDYLLEGIANATVENLFKDVVKIEGRQGLKSSVESAIREWGGIAIETEKGVYYLSKDADEIMNAMEKGTLSSIAEAGKLAKSMFKNAGSVEIKSLAGDAIVSMDSFAKKYGGMPREQMVERLMGKPGNYTRAEAETLAKKFEKIGGGKTPRPEPEPVKPDPTPGDDDWFIWDKAKKLNWKKGLKYLAGAAALYFLWKWLTSEKSPFPECLRKRVGTADAEKVKAMGIEALVITKTGNGDIDSAGGGIFYDDGKFASVNGRYKGTWAEQDGGIVITIGDKPYVLDCNNIPVPPVPVPPPTPGKCKPCSSFPMNKWCKSDKIKEVQKCIGTTPDGCYGPKTEAKLIEKGYSTTITQDVYDKIIKNCGQSATDDTGNEIPNIVTGADV
jgi:hypothetical protein